MSNKFDPNIRVERNLDYELKLPFEEACDLSGDLATVQEVAECILYVTQNQADSGGIELNNDESDKWRYARILQGLPNSDVFSRLCGQFGGRLD